MILKIIIASIVIYLVYVLYNKYILRENLNIENGKLLKMCKNKCDDTYKRCIQNHCNEVIESNHRKRRRANEKEDLHVEKYPKTFDLIVTLGSSGARYDNNIML